MARHIARVPLPSPRFLAVLTIMVAGILMFTEESANAVTMPYGNRADDGGRDHGNNSTVHNGRGVKNMNYSAAGSPTILSGLQEVQINVSGQTNTQAAFCKRRRHGCKIHQNIWALNRW